MAQEQTPSEPQFTGMPTPPKSERWLLHLLALQLALVFVVVIGAILLLRELRALDRAVGQFGSDVATVQQKVNELEVRLDTVSQRSEQIANQVDALVQGKSAAAAPSSLPPIRPPDLKDLAQVPRERRILGNPTAPLRVVVWGDYQCPACATFERQLFPQILERYIIPGRVRWEFRDLVFIGPESLRAAEAAACAEEQGKFWEYHRGLYENFVGSNRGSYTDARLTELAAVLGLDVEAFQSCLVSGRHVPAIRESIQQALDAGVQATPSFSINGGAPFTIARAEDLFSRIEGALP